MKSWCFVTCKDPVRGFCCQEGQDVTEWEQKGWGSAGIEHPNQSKKICVYIHIPGSSTYVRFSRVKIEVYRPWKIQAYPGSPSRPNFCPLVVGNPLYMNHPRNNSMFRFGLPHSIAWYFCKCFLFVSCQQRVIFEPINTQTLFAAASSRFIYPLLPLAWNGDPNRWGDDECDDSTSGDAFEVWSWSAAGREWWNAKEFFQ